MAIIFFRNDDVRDSLEDGLIELTELFLKHGVPITHAIEPANVTTKVIRWLLNKKKEYPDLIEFIQHGYNHNVNYKKVIGGKLRKGEFGGERNYRQEFQTLSKGNELMKSYFGKQWTPVISFPYGAYNENTIIAACDLGYLGLSSSISYNNKSLIKDKIGRIFKKDIIFNRRVSYHDSFRKNTNIFEIDISVNFIRKYINENRAIHFSCQELIDKVKKINNKTQIIGVLLHHRYHIGQIEELEKFIIKLKKQNFSFSTLNDIINERKQ